LRRRIEETIATILRQPRDRTRIARDVLEMRALVAKEKGTEDRWDLKQVRGGLVDLEFMAQFLQLVHAAERPSILNQGTVGALEAAASLGLITPAQAETLIPAARLTNALTQVLRLCLDGPFDSKSAPDGLKLLLCHAAGLPAFSRLEAELAGVQAEVARLFDAIVSP
jgi:glutamate-ammonia-ligase adenylyltransferase